MDDLSPLQQNQIQQQAAYLQIAQVMQGQKELVKLAGKCYEKCTGTNAPGRSLGSSEQTCIWRCAQRWTESGFFLNKYMEERALKLAGDGA